MLILILVVIGLLKLLLSHLLTLAWVDVHEPQRVRLVCDLEALSAESIELLDWAALRLTGTLLLGPSVLTPSAAMGRSRESGGRCANSQLSPHNLHRMIRCNTHTVQHNQASSVPGK